MDASAGFPVAFLSSVKAMASINRASMSSETPDGMWLRSPIQKLIPPQQSKALKWTLAKSRIIWNFEKIDVAINWDWYSGRFEIFVTFDMLFCREIYNALNFGGNITKILCFSNCNDDVKSCQKPCVYKYCFYH